MGFLLSAIAVLRCVAIILTPASANRRRLHEAIRMTAKLNVDSCKFLNICVVKKLNFNFTLSLFLCIFWLNVHKCLV